MMKNRSNLEKDLENMQLALDLEREEHRKTKIKLRMREDENHAITTSISYKIAKVLAKAKHYLRVQMNYLLSFNPIRQLKITKNKRYVEKWYKSPYFLSAFNNKRTSDMAVIIHLYYVDMIPVFMKHIKSLNYIKYDLYISVTDKDIDKIDYIKKLIPDARLVVVPNCGRDVLPFIEITRHTNRMGYKSYLKLHSKKSPHRLDGEQWRDRIIDSLIPNDKYKLKNIQKIIVDDKSAIIGPEDEYVSMLVNFHATAHHFQKLMPKILSKKELLLLMRSPDEYGFFAGTMFWINAGVVESIIKEVRRGDFEVEFGQEDTTMAHALERLFNIVPEFNNMKMYEMKDHDPIEIKYQTTNIPVWSHYSIED